MASRCSRVLIEPDVVGGGVGLREFSEACGLGGVALGWGGAKGIADVFGQAVKTGGLTDVLTGRARELTEFLQGNDGGGNGGRLLDGLQGSGLVAAGDLEVGA